MTSMQKITTNLWFDTQAEEAVKFYTSIFKNSRIGKVARYPNEGQEIHGKAPGSVMTMEFWIENQPFVALNGGPDFTFNEAISFIINCETQEEIDYYWEKLSEGGDERAQMCGWLKDKFGVSWQVVPKVLPELLTSTDPQKAQRAMKAMLHMKKLDIEALKNARDVQTA